MSEGISGLLVLLALGLFWLVLTVAPFALLLYLLFAFARWADRRTFTRIEKQIEAEMEEDAKAAAKTFEKAEGGR